MRNLTNTGIEVIVNTLSGGNAIEVLNNSINVDINKQPITSTTSSNDQYLLQDGNGNLKKILYSDLIGSSGSGLTAGTGINITNSFINYDINKETSYSSPASADTMLLYDTTNGATKKITFSNFNSGLQAQITNNDSDISTLTSSVNSNTSAIALNTAAISNITSPESATNIGTTATGSITLGNSSQTLALNSASMTAISAGKHFFRSNLSSGLSYEVQGFSSSSPAYHSVLQIQNVTSGYPYLSFLTNSGFQTSQLANKSIVIDANGRLDVANLPQTLGGGIGISIDSTPDINIDFTTLATATQVFSNNQFIIYSDSDSLYKNITFQNILNSIDLSPAFNFGTSASYPVNIGNANNQTLTLQGSLININGSNKIKNRSTVSTGTCWEVDGYNSNDVAYYSCLKLDNSNVATVRPTVDILGSSGFYGGTGQTLTIDANGKIDWITPSTTGTVLEQYNTTTDLLNSVQTSGKMALVKNPLKLWVYANLSSGLVWRSLSFDTATNLSLNQATYDINSTGSAIFNSGATITASSTGDVVKITVKVNDDLNPTVVNSLTSSTQTALDGWDGSSVVSMANAFSITDNQDGTYTYEGQLKTKNETDTTAISYTITDINSSTILTFNYSIQNSAPTGFGTGSPAIGGYYAIFNIWTGAYFVQSSTNYSSLYFAGYGQYYYIVNQAGGFDGYYPSSGDPTNTSNNYPMIFHFTQKVYNGVNISNFFATTYNGAAGSYTSDVNRNFPAGHSTGNMTFTSIGNDEYYMYSSNYQMSTSQVSPDSRMSFASGQNTTYNNQSARWKFYRVA